MCVNVCLKHLIQFITEIKIIYILQGSFYFIQITLSNILHGKLLYKKTYVCFNFLLFFIKMQHFEFYTWNIFKQGS